MLPTNETRESLIAELAELEADEPACNCAYHGDECDPSECDYHDHHSPYNREHARLTAAIAWHDAEGARVASLTVESVCVVIDAERMAA